jgi:hypothetical protein
MTAQDLPVRETSSTAQDYAEVTLFSVSAWKASVPTDTWWIKHLTADVLEGIRTHPMDAIGLSALRTQPTLQQHKEEHWRCFFEFCRRTFDSILLSAPELRYQHFGMRAWGVEINSDTWKKDLRYGPARIVETHNHTPAVFTSVFACELPDYPPPEELATVFHNPAKHMICPWQPRVVLVPPKVGQLLVFPGWIEHSAPVVQPIAEGQRRVIISVDYFPDYFNAAFEPTSPEAGLSE